MSPAVAHSETLFHRLGAQCFHLTFSMHITRARNLSCRQTSSSLRISARQSLAAASITGAGGVSLTVTGASGVSAADALIFGFVTGAGSCGGEMGLRITAARLAGGEATTGSEEVAGITGSAAGITGSAAGITGSAAGITRLAAEAPAWTVTGTVPRRLEDSCSAGGLCDVTK
jgi:hypothetical protein